MFVHNQTALWLFQGQPTQIFGTPSASGGILTLPNTISGLVYDITNITGDICIQGTYSPTKPAVGANETQIQIGTVSVIASTTTGTTWYPAFKIGSNYYQAYNGADPFIAFYDFGYYNIILQRTSGTWRFYFGPANFSGLNQGYSFSPVTSSGSFGTSMTVGSPTVSGTGQYGTMKNLWVSNISRYTNPAGGTYITPTIDANTIFYANFNNNFTNVVGPDLIV